MKQKQIDIPAFALAQQALLKAELAAEESETASLLTSSSHSPTSLHRAGLALTNLTISTQRTGLGGKTVVDLVPDLSISSNPELGEHGIRTGDVVLLAEQPSGSAKKRDVKEMERRGGRGVVVKVSRGVVCVAVDGGDEAGGGGKGGKDEEEDVVGRIGGRRVWIVKLADEVTFKRMNGTMEKLQKMSESEYSIFIRVLFGLSSPSLVPADLTSDPEFGKIDWADPTLNDSQKDAIRFSLASKEIALIHGPPGTGKTHTLIELILQMLKRNLRILVCGPSNISVDNIVERLAPHKVPIVRLGHPARLLPSVLNHSLDVLTRTSEAGAIVQDVRAEMDAKQASIRKTRNGRERRAIYADLKELRKEYRVRERKCVSNLVAGSKVVLATLHGAGGFQLRNDQFDVVIIDEASQALEAQCWVPLLSAKKAVCAGDHLQLPPTIKSVNSKTKSDKKTKDGITLETTLFDRLLALHGPAIKRMLTTQYRMHEKIMRFPSDELYESKLVAADAVKDRLLKGLPYDVEATDETTEPLIFIDTQGGDFPERNEEDDGDADASQDKGRIKRSLYGDSKSNAMEAALVRQHVRTLVQAGVKPEDIAVVTPYNAQVRGVTHPSRGCLASSHRAASHRIDIDGAVHAGLIWTQQLAILAPLKETYPGIELGSVDGFQGREKEAVIVSLVRSNADGEVGFLGEKRRLNVAMTRPKRSLTVIGDSETVKRGSKFLKKWIEFLEDNADLRYPDVTSLAQEG
ncbi:P-loop containing nucleoside triphosphate hydrolase protein [Echria macrotheca]|uniref:DNA helicase n=1 Tax=Echria macrotheca TaxID=438768 RepID=A0AAJ0BBQ7_9PEZI|nr:P-loop containing nucleoside triphosphate hydrolase protein [Echria macrotheca]